MFGNQSIQPSFHVRASGLTDTGKSREQNEDAFAICDDLGLYIVSDGMGGAQSGELASALVTQALPAEIGAPLDGTPSPESELAQRLTEAIGRLSRQMHEQSLQDSRLAGMGATVVACLVREGAAVLAHMGDSRAYLFREGVLERLTEDHALGETLLRMGQISEEEAKEHPGRHMLTRNVGMAGGAGPEVGLLTLKEGDRLLLCSDGLSTMVEALHIAEILASEPEPAGVCETLVRAANRAGGEDNITAVVLQYGRFTPPERPPAVRREIAHSVERYQPRGERE